MTEISAVGPCGTRHELRFISLSDRGRGYTFACDAQGHVDIDALSDRGRASYFFARAMVGFMLSAPTVSRLPDEAAAHGRL
ncbi:MAG TPA: hypothetical protein VFU71_18005 [Burkholderiaceae bacterium]|nr:hypothetical protein [Burkholderiaceae bacterium]